MMCYINMEPRSTEKDMSAISDVVSCTQYWGVGGERLLVSTNIFKK